jgi:hypothetical protein
VLNSPEDAHRFQTVEDKKQEAGLKLQTEKSRAVHMARPLPQRSYRIGLAWRIAVPSSASVAKRKIVDHGLELSIKKLFDWKLIEQDALRAGSLSWDSDTFQFEGTVRFEADLRDPETASIRLEYQTEGMDISYRISLVSIRPPFGGRRWYFCCPVEHIRVSKLFLPPGARRFASRQAHGLPDFLPIRAKPMKMPAV